MTTQRCINCAWYSDGFGDDVRGSGWCYSSECYMDMDDTCPFWELTLRKEPLNPPPETQLVEAVAQKDITVDD